MARFLDYQKGCYVGQEPVFRVHAQGAAAKTLRGLCAEAPLVVGAPIQHPQRANAGTVTSAVDASRWGVHGLAMLHRTAWDVGSVVDVGGVRATVVEVPVA